MPRERYFEMDLMRRTAAGELAGLFGPVAVGIDSERRVHRIRARVTGHLDAFAGDRMPQLQAYADGVNAGLGSLHVRPGRTCCCARRRGAGTWSIRR